MGSRAELAIPQLIELLKEDKPDGIREAAATALGKMGREARAAVVPHSPAEEAGSRCTLLLAGRVHPVAILHTRLVENFTLGNWSREVKIPDHGHGTHVVQPVDGRE
jgi:hypothetical protein